MRWVGLTLGLALVVAVAAPAAAGRLITHDGATIETDGEWEVRGALVIFERDGRLASIRLSEVDLEASRKSRPEPVESAAPAPARASKPVLVLTDADVRHVRPARGETPDEPVAADDETESPDSAPEEAAEAPAEPRLEIGSWRDEVNVEAGALEVTGTVANRGSSVVTDTRLEVRLVDEAGRVVERRGATISRKVLAPGASSAFKASFPGSPGYASVEFDVRGRGFKVRSPGEGS